MTKKFTAQPASNNTVKVFDATTGQLYKVINAGGRIDGQPTCTDQGLFLTVQKGTQRVLNHYSLPQGGLKSSKPL